MIDPVTLGVTPADTIATSTRLAYNAIFSSLANAAFIGGLAEDKSDINVLSQLSSTAPVDVYSFNFEQGSAIKLGFSNDTATTDLRVQLLDVTGAVVADSAGTTDQQAAYTSLTSTDGLNAATGTYYVRVSYVTGAAIYDQSYDFQLYSGATYDTSFVTTAQTQAYDPNLFVAASASVTPPSNLVLYTRTAALSSDPKASTALNIGRLDSNGTELDVVSQITKASSAEYFAFDFHQGSTIKLSAVNQTGSTLLRVQLFDSTGKTVLADSGGTDAQVEAYARLTSGTGLAAKNGHYIVKVSATVGQVVSEPQFYNFQLYSGNSYGTIYKTNAALPQSAAPMDVNVYASSEAQLFSRQAFNHIGANAFSAVGIGWLAENKSRLDVVSQLTTADASDFYSFTFQQGSALKLAFANTTNTADARVQLFDLTGRLVYADSHGNAAQKAAYAKLTSADGLNANPGQYTVQVSYAPGADHTKTQNYNFQVYSGSVYTNSYKTIASAQTLANALLSGNAGSTGYSSAGAAASMLRSLSQGTPLDMFQSLSRLV